MLHIWGVSFTLNTNLSETNFLCSLLIDNELMRECRRVPRTSETLRRTKILSTKLGSPACIGFPAESPKHEGLCVLHIWGVSFSLKADLSRTIFCYFVLIENERMRGCRRVPRALETLRRTKGKKRRTEINEHLCF